MIRLTCASAIALFSLFSIADAQHKVELDHAVFSHNAEQAVIEVYVGVVGDVDADSNWQLPVEFTLSQGQEQVSRDVVDLSLQHARWTQVENGSRLVGKLQIPAAPGTYDLLITLLDQQPSPRQVVVPNFTEGRNVQVSDFLVASGSAESDEAGNPLLESGRIYHPHPDLMFGRNAHELHFYFESYHTDRFLGANDACTYFVYLTEANRTAPLQNWQQRIEREPSMTDAVFGSFDVSDLPSGSYLLNLEVQDSGGQTHASKSKRFFVFNPGVEQLPAEYTAAEAVGSSAVISEAELDQQLQQVRLIADPREAATMRRLQDVEEKRQFLQAFWERRDANPQSPVNEFQMQFLQRIEMANQRFADRGTDGWRSQRGEVFVKYGEPASVESRTYEQGTAPYEVWQYHNIPGEGQAIFVFVDRTGFGSFELVHSSVAGERKNPNWQYEIQRRR